MEKPVYFQYDGVPGDYFNCPTGCTISVERCRQTYQKAKGLKASDVSRWSACIGCNIGMLHCGESSSPKSVKAKHICCRCHEFAYRLLSSGVCVSCANRQAEIRKGRNRRDGVPVAYETFWGIPKSHYGKCKTVKLHDITLMVRENGHVYQETIKDSSTVLEAVMRETRKKKVQLDFSWRRKVDSREGNALALCGGGSVTYELVDHACKFCFGRIAAEIKDGKRTGVYRCMECGMEGRNGYKSLCCCGMTLRPGQDAGLRCIRNADQTAEFPSEIVVRSGVDVKGV